MPVGFDNSGHDGFSGKVDHLSLRMKFFEFLCGSDGEDPATTHGHRLHLGESLLQGENMAVDIDLFGLWLLESFTTSPP